MTPATVGVMTPTPEHYCTRCGQPVAVTRAGRWSAEEDALASDPALSTREVALRLGRTYPSVQARRAALRNPERLRREKSAQARRRQQETATGDRMGAAWSESELAAVLDESRTAREVAADIGRSYHAVSAKRLELRGGPRIHPRRRASLNSDLRARGTRHWQEWTGPELELAADYSRTAREVAEITGRTLYAVRNIRHKLREDPRKARLADLSTDVAERARPSR